MDSALWGTARCRLLTGQDCNSCRVCVNVPPCPENSRRPACCGSVGLAADARSGLSGPVRMMLTADCWLPRPPGLSTAAVLLTGAISFLCSSNPQQHRSHLNTSSSPLAQTTLLRNKHLQHEFCIFLPPACTYVSTGKGFVSWLWPSRQSRQALAVLLSRPDWCPGIRL